MGVVWVGLLFLGRYGEKWTGWVHVGGLVFVCFNSPLEFLSKV